MIGAILAAALSAGAAGAAVTFDTFDCDADGMADFVGGACTQRAGTDYAMDVIFDPVSDSTGGRPFPLAWALRIEKPDTGEIRGAPPSWSFSFSDAPEITGTVALRTATRILLRYEVSAFLPADFVIGTLRFATGRPLDPAASDGLPDISMFGDASQSGTRAPSLSDPATGERTSAAHFEVQSVPTPAAVPVPAAALLLAGGLGALAATRTRRRG
jgi:hypothetical protein